MDQTIYGKNDLLSEVRQDVKKARKDKREGKTQPEVAPRKRKGIGIRAFIARFFLVMVLVVTGVAYTAEWYVDWRAGHEWQFPAKWIGMVRSIERTVVGQNANAGASEPVTPMTDMQVIEQYHLSPAIKTIYFLESTSGQKDGCKDTGMVNGYGYRQNSGEWKCYPTFEQVTDKVNEWLEDRLAMNGNNLVEAICFYNKGIQGMNVCDYSENFMGVLTKNF